MIPETRDNIYQPHPEVAKGIREQNYNHGYFKGYKHGWEDMKKAVQADLYEQADKYESIDPELSEVIHIVIHNLWKSL